MYTFAHATLPLKSDLKYEQLKTSLKYTRKRNRHNRQINKEVDYKLIYRKIEPYYGTKGDFHDSFIFMQMTKTNYLQLVTSKALMQKNHLQKFSKH